MRAVQIPRSWPRLGGGGRFTSSDSLLSIYVPAFILAVGVGIAAPALPLFAKSFQIDFGMASLAVIVNQLGATVFTIPTGLVIDRVGGRKMILLGPLLTALSSLLMATAHTFPELLVYRFIEGCAMQMWVMGRLELITARGGAKRGTQITGMFGMDAAGRLMGPAIGGFVAAAWGLKAPFVLYGLIALVSVLPSFFLVPNSDRKAVQTDGSGGAPGSGWRGTRAALAQMLTLPIILLLFGQFMASMTRGSLFGGTLDLYAVYAYGIGPKTLGFLAAAGGLLGLPLTFASGRLMDRFGRRTTIVPGFGILGVAMISMAMAAFAHWSFSGYVVTFLFARISISAISGSMQVVGSDVAPPNARGTFFGIWGLMRQVGGFLSPATFALVSRYFGFGASFAVLAGMSFFTALLLGRQIKATQRPTSTVSANVPAAEIVGVDRRAGPPA